MAETSKGVGKGPPMVPELGRAPPAAQAQTTVCGSLADAIQQGLKLRPVAQESLWNECADEDISEPEPMDQICFSDALEQERSQCWRNALYLGSIKGALMGDSLEARNVRTVLSILHETGPQITPELPNVRYWRSPPVLDDSSQETIQTYERFLDDAHRVIDEGLARGSVLVHCMMGVSRSTTVVASYMMRKCGLGRDESLRRIQQCRPIARPNAGLYQLLGRLQEESLPERSPR
eukprot:CAMPEP_0194525280 /NCGR_PEP_ID=MMETSP0253-20130528/60694_1 /TAXON_ID=2966 /ORGANISM="Noctiluca scintillans" /LENGTH=234 /DNA_ID=CAMNT_0039369989 /DNA_START=33 /DNA_END=734 /DNA_ORIENTATION=-